MSPAVSPAHTSTAPTSGLGLHGTTSMWLQIPVRDPLTKSVLQQSVYTDTGLKHKQLF